MVTMRDSKRKKNKSDYRYQNIARDKKSYYYHLLNYFSKVIFFGLLIILLFLSYSLAKKDLFYFHQISYWPYWLVILTIIICLLFGLFCLLDCIYSNDSGNLFNRPCKKINNILNKIKFRWMGEAIKHNCSNILKIFIFSLLLLFIFLPKIINSCYNSKKNLEHLDHSNLVVSQFEELVKYPHSFSLNDFKTTPNLDINKFILSILRNKIIDLGVQNYVTIGMTKRIIRNYSEARYFVGHEKDVTAVICGASAVSLGGFGRIMPTIAEKTIGLMEYNY